MAVDYNRRRNLIYLLFGVPAVGLVVALAFIKEPVKPTDRRPPSKPSSSVPKKSATSGSGQLEKLFQKKHPLVLKAARDGVTATLVQISHVRTVQQGKLEPALAIVYLIEFAGDTEISRLNQGPVQLLDTAGKSMPAQSSLNQNMEYAKFQAPGIPLPDVTNPQRTFVQTHVFDVKDPAAVDTIVVHEGCNGKTVELRFSGLATE